MTVKKIGIALIAIFVFSIFATATATSVQAQPPGLRILLFADDYSTSTGDVYDYLSPFTEFSTIDSWNYNQNHTLPSLAELLTYDALLVWTNYNPPSTLGDLVSDYVDAGGRIVVMTFADTNSWDIGGRYVSTGKNLLAPMYPYYQRVYLGEKTIPSHPVLEGVNTFSTSYNDPNMDTVNGGVVIARYTTGHILAAQSPTGNIVALNFFPSFSWSGDGALLMRNALVFVVTGGYYQSGLKVVDASAGASFSYAISPGFTYSSFVDLLDAKTNAFEISSVAITQLDITSTRSFQHIQLLIGETNTNPIDPTPVQLQSGITLYKYEKLVIGVPPYTITQVAFSFKVPQAWFSSNGVAKASIALYEFDGTAWNALSTTLSSEDTDFAYYTSMSTGQGIFAIAG